ncbi:hypothetical protein HN371_05720 [Candidatus Poribacteria bacterium]|nr:hypothetical protein [Candidatus Poribacteria bacterium]MBT5533804.1 hypothetical protein [Candidatus Poribacteria bacterium]MBT5713877.1 hypothetical protein [Candidatus Poribacteria bacterium]MBT7101355.1 hypothetical protein [Candidatus Poribacteria bacterium]MBT7806281.1 hypothetical protein [Candidatus Poribacteria bacterium]
MVRNRGDVGILGRVGRFTLRSASVAHAETYHVVLADDDHMALMLYDSPHTTTRQAMPVDEQAAD